MKNKLFYPGLIRKYGTEDSELIETTLPWYISENTQLIAILTGKSSGDAYVIEIALDITEPKRQILYLAQVEKEIWSNIRLFYLPTFLIEHCLIGHDI